MKSVLVKIGKGRKIVERADNRLRMMCDRLSPRRRFVLVIISLILFAVTAVYMAIGSIYFAHRPELNIEHIEGLKLPRANNDSINNLIIRNHDDTE